MPNDGKNLQRLVRTLESVLNDGQKVKIESPKRLPIRSQDGSASMTSS